MESAENVIKNNDIFRTLRKVSLIFFFFVGLVHILTGLMVSQNLLLPISNIINRTLDIPFAVLGTVYGLSQIKIDSESPFKKPYLTFIVMISLLVLAILLYINFLLPDKIS